MPKGGRPAEAGPRITWTRARAITGDAKRVLCVTEHQFDRYQDELERMARTPQEEIDPGDLWYYHHDLAYRELQPELFAYLFPVCLMDWQATLLENEPCSHGDSDFHSGLRHGKVLARMLDADQHEQLYAFFRDGFLDRVEHERGLEPSGRNSTAHGWIARYNSLGYLLPDIAETWDTIWSLASPGAAVCLLQYCSGLMYEAGENPFFTRWTRERGGGGPCLWDDDTQINDAGWLPANVAFLRRALHPGLLRRGLGRALERLRDEPEEEAAARLVSDLPRCSRLLQHRARILPDLLASPTPPFDWPAPD